MFCERKRGGGVWVVNKSLRSRGGVGDWWAVASGDIPVLQRFRLLLPAAFLGNLELHRRAPGRQEAGPSAVPCAATQALGALGDGLRKKLPFKKKLFLFLLVAKVLSLRGGELPVPFWGFFWVDCFYIWNVKQV